MESLREDWNATKRVAGGSLETAELRLVRQTTSLTKLADRYKRFMVFSILWSVITPVIMYRLSVEFGITPTWLVPALFTFIMVCGAATDYYLYARISRIDVLTMGVAEVAAESLKCRKLHVQYVCVMLPFALGVVGLTVYLMRGDQWIVNGMLIGGAVGLVIGVAYLYRFMRDYSKINLTD